MPVLRLPLLPAAAGKQHWGNLPGAALSLAIAEAASAAKRFTLLLTADSQSAERLEQELSFFAPDLPVLHFPDWETLPYDQFSPHQDLVSERLATLYRIQRGEFDVAVVPAPTALARLCPPAYLAARTFFLQAATRLDADALRSQLATAGYQHVTQVVAPGEYCLRGGLIDLYPAGSALPYRIDLDDDLIDSIKTFDVDTQRTLYAVNEIRMLPAREFPLDDAGRARFRSRWRELFEGDPSRKRLYRDVSNGVPAPGIEYYLPLFFESAATLFDYLPSGCTLALHRDVAGAIDEFWREAGSRFRMLGGDPERPLLPPAQLFLSAEEFYVRLREHPRVDLLARAQADEEAAQPFAAAALPPLAVDRRAQDPLAALKRFLDTPGLRVLIAAESPGRRATIAATLGEHGIRPAQCNAFAEFVASDSRLALSISPLAGGFVLAAEGWAVVTEAELYAGVVRRRARPGEKRASVEGMLRDLSELKVGDAVVHEQHGIGRYLGLVSLDLGDGANEFLLLEYDGGDRLYVPVSQLAVVSRYSGADPSAAPLHKLGSGQWDRAKARAARQVRDTAAELLALYARRAARLGHAFGVGQHDLEAFADGFGFEETVDQAAAIEAVVKDMAAGKPMDRLVCGDVGFGKTEVALRAAFVAAADGRQVAVLCPTTLLVEQHFQTFSDRFADWPVKIAELSRFRSQKQVGATLAALTAGKVDIVIGTHKLLQQDIKFRNLGLVIIDEEHRFGVRQKERLKALRAEVDVLTLTATPIPRTLGMALEGLRDFSVIATAPQRRLAIKTFVARSSRGLIREAALRELKRGGQVYFLHNDVDTIAQAGDVLARLVPEARVRIAHGQMRERELETTMRDFYQQRFNILLCTTIIETGIDIPTANTIIINRADKFGLAQLHQLRGRVGRSHHQAYAYLLLPDEGEITSRARKRLEAIQLMEELGSGFFLAMHDLEIRGAGEVLGDRQSGEMQEVGFNLYCAMLDTAVKSLKLGREPDLSAPLGITTEINLHAPALLPEDYCNDTHERLVLYKRLANCDTLEQLDAMHEELIDRFGAPPGHARTLLDSHRLRVISKPLGIARIDASETAVQLQFVPNPPIDAARVMQLIQRNTHYRLAGQDRLRITADLHQVSERVARVRQVFGELTG